MTWWDGVKILAGTALTSFAFRFFTFPNHIVSGGVTGIAQIVNMLTGFPVGVFTILMNIPLFLLAWKKLGRRFVALTAVCMGLSSVSIDLLEKLARPLTEDPMLAAVYGGGIKGVGFGLIYTTGATTGGADIPARMLRRKYPHINFGTFSLGINAVIILSFAVIFRRFDSSMYTLICMYISSKVISLILYGPIDSRLCYIISDRSEELRSAITERLGRGATLLLGKAGELSYVLAGVTAALRGTDVSLRPERDREGRPVLRITVSARAGVTGMADPAALTPALRDRLGQALSQALAADAEAAVRASRELGADFLELGRLFDGSADLSALRWELRVRAETERSYDVDGGPALRGEEAA